MTSILRSSTTQTNTTLPLSQPATQSRKRFVANPIRPQQKPIPLRPTQPTTTTTTTTKPSPHPSHNQPSAPTPTAAPALTSTQPSQPTNAGVTGPEIGGMAVTDATTLPRARVLEVTRRLDGSTTRLAIRVQLLASGEEKEIDDRGGGPISVAADIQQGDLITLTPSGPHTFQWTKSIDPTAAQPLKPKRRRRPFTVDDLLSPLGVARVLATFPTQQWKGYGYEREDVGRLCWLYKVWMSEMFPHAHPAVLTRRMEVMGGTRRVQRYMDAFRYEGKVKGEREERDKRQKVDEQAAIATEKEPLQQDAAMQLMDEVYGREDEHQSAEQELLELQLLQQHEEEVREAVEPPVGQGSSFDEAMRQLGLLPPLPANESTADTAVFDDTTNGPSMELEQSSIEATHLAVDTQQPDQTQQDESHPHQSTDSSTVYSPIANTDPGAQEAAVFDSSESSEKEVATVRSESGAGVAECTIVPETLEYAAGELELSAHDSTDDVVQQVEGTVEVDISPAVSAAVVYSEAEDIPSSLAE